MFGERKALPEAQLPLQIDDLDLARSPEAVEPHLSRDHHRWAFLVGVVLAVVLTVRSASGHRRLHDQLGMGGSGRMRVQRGALSNRIKA